MNRRSFLKRLAITVAGASCGATLLTDRLTAKAATAAVPLPVNPAWVSAPYEESFIFAEGTIERLMAAEAGRLSADIVRSISKKSPWADLVG